VRCDCQRAWICILRRGSLTRSFKFKILQIPIIEKWLVFVFIAYIKLYLNKLGLIKKIDIKYGCDDYSLKTDVIESTPILKHSKWRRCAIAIERKCSLDQYMVSNIAVTCKHKLSTSTVQIYSGIVIGGRLR